MPSSQLSPISNIPPRAQAWPQWNQTDTSSMATPPQSSNLLNLRLISSTPCGFLDTLVWTFNTLPMISPNTQKKIHNVQHNTDKQWWMRPKWQLLMHLKRRATCYCTKLPVATSDDAPNWRLPMRWEFWDSDFQLHQKTWLVSSDFQFRDYHGCIRINIHRWWINSHGYGWYPWIIHGIHKNSKSVFYLKNVIFCTISM